MAADTVSHETSLNLGEETISRYNVRRRHREGDKNTVGEMGFKVHIALLEDPNSVPNILMATHCNL